VFTAINQYRAQQGRTQLPADPALSRAAEKYARFLAQRDQALPQGDAGHQLDGRTPTARAQAEGYGGGVRENIQWSGGFAHPAAAAMTSWKNSPPHNANMVNPGHTAMGVGAAVSATGKWFFVADFGQQGGPGAGPGGGGQLTRYTITVTN